MLARKDEVVVVSSDDDEDEPKMRPNGRELDLKRCSYVDCRGEDVLLKENILLAPPPFCVLSGLFSFPVACCCWLLALIFDEKTAREMLALHDPNGDGEAGIHGVRK